MDGRYLRYVIVTLCAVPGIGIVALNYETLRSETPFEWLELLAILSAYIISAINYVKVLNSVTDLIGECPKVIKEEIGDWSISIVAHFVCVMCMYIGCILLILKHASVFPFLGILFCIYAMFICSNVHVLRLVGNAKLLSVHVDKANSEKAVDNYLMSVMANMFFLKQENTPTFIAYLLLLAVSAGILRVNGLNDYFHIKAFASGAAAVHLTISTFRFWQVMNDTSELPLHRQDVLEMAFQILSPKNREQMVRAHGASRDVFTDRWIWSAHSAILTSVLVVGAGIAIWGTFLTR